MKTTPNNLQRRQFFKQGIGGMLAIGSLPSIVSAKTLGLNGRIGPNSRINLAFIGMGKIMPGHFGLALRNSIQATYVCDVDLTKAEHYKGQAERKKMGEVKVTSDYETVVNDPSVDAVMVATPDHWHAAISLAAMRMGKDVYVEKPMTLTIEEGQLMVTPKSVIALFCKWARSSAQMVLFEKLLKLSGMAGLARLKRFTRALVRFRNPS